MKKRKRYSPDIVSATAPDYCERAAKVIRDGGVIAIPTETYYGIAANPFNEQALKKIYTIKKRPDEKPVLVLIENIAQLSLLVRSVPDAYHPLMKKWWPGPLTLIFPALETVSEILTGNTGSVGVRLTSSSIAKQICSASGSPITATSANLSGKKAAVNVSEIIDTFGAQLDLIVDGGESAVTTGSTVVGMSKTGPCVIRPGVLDINF